MENGALQPCKKDDDLLEYSERWLLGLCTEMMGCVILLSVLVPLLFTDDGGGIVA